jgi:hypothetical protein
MNRRFDGDALREPEIAALLGDAPDAREYLARLESIDAALRSLPLEPLPDGLEIRILAELSRSAEARVPGGLVYASVALVVVLAGFVGWLNPGLLEMPGVSQVLTAVDADASWVNLQAAAVDSAWSMWDLAISTLQPFAITSNVALWLSIAIAGCGLFAFNAIAAVRLRPVGK